MKKVLLYGHCHHCQQFDIKSTVTSTKTLSISIENISPEFYAKSLGDGFNPIKTSVNTLKFNFDLEPEKIKRIVPAQPQNADDSKYIILGDSRDGYETFDQIIAQVDALKPVFAINNGDLVFSGKPNQYRLFDRTVSKLSTTLCTTLGNHDIRNNGLETYTKLYGPGFYSFDFGNSHFTFLDSSPGWSQKRAISDEQYAWLERDLKKAQGIRIYVITHIPPKDPRSETKPNEISYYVDKAEQGSSFFEKKLDDYNENKSLNHGFQDTQEAERFENLMTAYKVDTVYLSHIHSFFDYSVNGVRYIISGGAGAELLTRNSYYHYMFAKTGVRDSVTMVQLPSPANVLLKRYSATVSLFAEAMYQENRAAVISFIIGFILLVVLLILFLFIKFNHRLNLLWILMKDTGKYAVKRCKELYKSKR